MKAEFLFNKYTFDFKILLKEKKPILYSRYWIFSIHISRGLFTLWILDRCFIFKEL